ncbi:hypothetical protein DVK00_02900 [Haloarcula sp. Atlit-47R]|uniref:hypothetical protein n=1 Tax=Haloarcula sp. Atlit-47R TaxID=2282132 RepID=UPI000EF23F50|nr:hypothetical protein [Haloarcula sp. Atlit-47R]RLM47473.1 hypothetical protein DVK00_02900 [Haloarcula sp. Atlit-47R]
MISHEIRQTVDAQELIVRTTDYLGDGNTYVFDAVHDLENTFLWNDSATHSVRSYLNEQDGIEMVNPDAVSEFHYAPENVHLPLVELPTGHFQSAPENRVSRIHTHRQIESFLEGRAEKDLFADFDSLEAFNYLPEKRKLWVEVRVPMNEDGHQLQTLKRYCVDCALDDE